MKKIRMMFISSMWSLTNINLIPMVVLLSDNNYVIPVSAQRLNTNVRGETRSKERDFEQKERQQQRFNEKESRRKRRFQQFEEKKAQNFESFSSSYGTKNRENFDTRFQKEQEEETNEYTETINAFYDAYKSIASNSQNSRHILQGAGKAFTSTLFGLFSGFPFLLGFPIALSKTESLRGWPGVIFGLILGAFSSAITTTIGVFNGARQLLIGAWNTPSAISSYFFQGKIWDMKENEWKTYVLDDEAEELLDPAKCFKNEVSDSTYYNLLGINPGSTSKEVKQAYYTKARDLHPDKNPDDDEAARQFIQIHEAYQTLIDPSKRADYDNLGRRASSSPSSDFNVGVFFEILFSSQPVEKYVGQLGVASFFGHWIKLVQSASGSDSSPTMDMFITWLKAFETQTLQRYVQVAVHLRDFVSPLATKALTKKEFLAMCQKEAETIAENSFGETFLIHIGSALVQEANLFLSQSWYGWPVWMFSTIRKKANNLKGKIRGFKMVTKVISDVTVLFNNTEVLDRIRGESENKLILNMTQIEEILPSILEIAWAFNAYDITKLLGKSCEKVFFDSKVPYGERRRRARALHLLGETFVQRGEAKSSTGGQCSTESRTCRNPESNAQDMKVRAEVAFRMAQQNARQKSSESEEMIKKAQKKRSA